MHAIIDSSKRLKSARNVGICGSERGSAQSPSSIARTCLHVTVDANKSHRMRHSEIGWGPLGTVPHI